MNHGIAQAGEYTDAMWAPLFGERYVPWYQCDIRNRIKQAYTSTPQNPQSAYKHRHPGPTATIPTTIPQYGVVAYSPTTTIPQCGVVAYSPPASPALRTCRGSSGTKLKSPVPWTDEP